jgi:hypothetical protein
MLSFKHYLTSCEYDIPHELLTEGGNIWKGDLATQAIKQADVLPTVKWLERITGLPLADNMVGSTGKKVMSGDIDLVVDANAVDKNQLVAKLTTWASANDPQALVKKSGVNVHFRTPIKGDPRNGYVQTDFMILPDLGFVKWSMSPAEHSEYRGAHRAILMASIAKSLGLRWSFMHGLSSRTTNNPLRGGKNPDYVAKILLGPDATAKDLDSVETILAKLKDDPAREEKIADARETFAKEGVKL